MEDLRPWFRKQLPRPVRGLMDDLEAFSGTLIQIVPRTEKRVMGSRMLPDRAQIAVPSATPFSVHSACHELLHIRRYWIEVAPRLIAPEPFVMFAAMFTNEVEHVVIGPMEEEFGFDPKTFTSMRLLQEWEKHNPTTTPDVFWRRTHTLRNLLQRDLLQGKVYERFRSEAIAEGLGDVAAFVEDVLILAVRTSTPRAYRAIINFLGLNSAEFLLHSFDIKTRSDSLHPLV